MRQPLWLARVEPGGGYVNIVDDSGICEGVEQDESRQPQRVLRGGFHLDLLMLFDLGLDCFLLLTEGIEVDILGFKLWPGAPA